MLAGVFVFGWNFLKLGEFADSLKPVQHEYVQVTVSGSSMDPTLRNGQKILVDKNAYIKKKIAKGDIVLVEFAKKKYVVKRVFDAREGQVYLVGDNANSIDSRAYGWVEKDRVVGKVAR